MKTLFKIIFHTLAVGLFFIWGVTILFGPVVTNSSDDAPLILWGIFVIWLWILLEVIIHYLAWDVKKKN